MQSCNTSTKLQVQITNSLWALKISSIFSVQKKVVSDNPGLVDFVIGLVNSVINLHEGQVKSFWRIKIT